MNEFDRQRSFDRAQKQYDERYEPEDWEREDRRMRIEEDKADMERDLEER